jgi:hypothetical protein
MEKAASPEHEYPKTGVYEHYKSTPQDKRYYQVLGFARNTETEEILAIYIPLYVIPEHKGLRLQARPLDMFMETVDYNGQTLPRFRYIGDEL